MYKCIVINTNNNMSDLPDLNSTEWGDDYWNQSLKDMSDTITKLELWDWLKIYSPPKDEGFMWSNHENINKISDGLVHNDHSGSSFAFALRTMEFIAKKGFSKWIELKKEETLLKTQLNAAKKELAAAAVNELNQMPG